MITLSKNWEEYNRRRGRSFSVLTEAHFPTPNQLSEAEPRPQGQHLQIDQLGGVAFRPKIQNHVIINGPVKADGKPWFTIVNKATADAAEVFIYEQIGKDWWSGEGVGAKDYRDALEKLDSTKSRNLDVHINSPGGNVYDGLAMRSIHQGWKGRVNTFNDGMAASIASVVLLSPANGGKVYASKESSTMIHRASTVAMGTVEDMQRAITALEAAEKNIMSVYVERTGKPESELSAAMAKETWFTGPEAKAFGFVDELTDTPPVSNSFNLSTFKHVPEAIRKLQNSAAQGGGQSHKTDLMDKATIIALLKEHGIEVDANATIEQLQAKLKEVLAKAKAQPDKPAPAAETSTNATENAALAIVQNELKAMREARDKERRANIASRVDALIVDRRVVASERDFLIESAMSDERHLTNAAARPQVVPEAPISAIIETSASPTDIANHVRRLSKEIGADISSGSVLAVAKAIERARTIRKNENKLVTIMNEGTNTVDATLKQDVLLDIGLRAFARVLFSLSGFSTMFSNLPLRGTDIVTVPFLDLETAASTDYNGANGYVAGDTTRDKRQVTINKRKYQGLSFTSSELARQPFLMIAETFALKGEKLAYDVWLDVLSLVKAATYGHATKADTTAVSPAPIGAWGADRIADLQQVASELNWPIPGRMLFANAGLDNQLKKDPALKLALNIGGSEVIRQGKLPNIYGFNYVDNANLPANGESLIGFIAWKSALLIATSPIPPTEEVVRDGTQYSMAVDPDTGIAMEYRSFGDSQKDKSLKFIECNYGYAGGNASALKRIATA